MQFSSFCIQDPHDLYDWDEQTQGIILSAFYYGYILTHLPGGILAEKFGGKYSLGLGVLSTAIFTMLTPWVARTGDWKMLVLLRIMVGLGEVSTLIIHGNNFKILGHFISPHLEAAWFKVCISREPRFQH